MLSVQEVVPEFENVSTVLPGESDTGSPTIGTVKLGDFLSFDRDNRTGWLVITFYPLDFAFKYPVQFDIY